MTPRRAANAVLLAALLNAAAVASDLSRAAPFELFPIEAVENRPGREVAVRLRGKAPVGVSRLLLMQGVQPLAWAVAEPGTAPASSTPFLVLGTPPTIAAAEASAYNIPLETIAELLPAWPRGGRLWARVESVGPGRRSAWLDTGWWAFAPARASFLHSTYGQPTARLDVRETAGTLSFAAVTPLASGLQLAPGARVELWPAPAEVRAGVLSSAVAYVEQVGSRPRIWIAAPPDGAACGPEPHVDFYRAGAGAESGEYIGYGVVERQDECFWYVDFRGGAPRQPVDPSQPRPTTSATSPATTTAGPLVRETQDVPHVPRPGVGDRAVLRTSSQIAQRATVPRVFEVSDATALINAGETEGLQPGQEALLYRGSDSLGRIRVVKAEPAYAVIAPLKVSNADSRPTTTSQASLPATRPALPHWDFRVGDEVRFAPPPAAPAVIGTIERVLPAAVEGADPLCVVRLSQSNAPLGRALAVRGTAGVQGIVVLVAQERGASGELRAGGFVVAASLAGAIESGAEVLAPPE